MTRTGRLLIFFLSLSLTDLALAVNVSLTSLALPFIRTNLGGSAAQ